MRKGFQIYEEMRKHLTTYEEAVSHIRLCNRSNLNFLIYEEYLIFFFVSVASGHSSHLGHRDRMCPSPGTRTSGGMPPTVPGGGRRPSSPPVGTGTAGARSESPRCARASRNKIERRRFQMSSLITSFQILLTGYTPRGKPYSRRNRPQDKVSRQIKGLKLSLPGPVCLKG